MSDENTNENEATGLAIDDADRDSSVGGGELIPVSDAGFPKSVSVAQVKDYVLARIAALTAANAVSVDDDAVYILRGGVMTRVSAAILAAAIFNEAFGRAAVASPNGNEVLAVKDSAARKTITLASLKTWLAANMTVTPDLTLANAGNAGTLGDSDLALVVQAASGKKVTLATLKDYVLGKLAAFVTAATAVQNVTSSDVIYLLQGGNMRKATISQLVAGIGAGDVIAPASHVPGNIPVWDDAAKRLTSGYGVATTIASTGASASKIPTEAAVSAALAGAGDVKKSGTQTSGSLVVWDNGGKATNGPAVVTSVGQTGADTNVPTEKAVRTAIADAATTLANAITAFQTGMQAAVATTVGALVRYDTVFVPAAAMVPSLANGAIPAAAQFGSTMRDVMGFGTSEDDSCEFDVVLPDDWNRGQVKAKLVWTTDDTNATVGKAVKWSIGGVVSGDGVSLDTAPSTMIDVTDALSAVNAAHRTDATAGFTPEGTAENGGVLHFVVRRNIDNPPSNSLETDALLLGVVLQFARTVAAEGWS